MKQLTKSALRASAAGVILCACTTALVIANPLTGLAPEMAHAQSNIIKIRQHGANATKDVRLGLNKAVVIDLPEDAHDILVADPGVADAVTRSSRRIYLFGKKVGQTNIFVFGASGKEIVSVNLSIERDVTGLQRQLARFIPDSHIKVEIINDNIVLTGTVRTPQDSARAAQLANIFVTGGEATTRNVTATGGDSSGGAAIYAEQRQKSQVVNMLQIDGEDQVTLKVTVAEVKRSILKQLGIDTSVNINAGSLATSLISANSPVESLIAGVSGGNSSTGNINADVGNFSLGGTIRAMQQANVFRTLAQPTLTAVSGETANFNVGGEVYFSTVTNSASGQTTLQGIQYGIKLNFTPVVLSPGRISLKIATEVSEPTTGVGGSFAKTERTAETSVELPSGGSIVIGGLISNDLRQTISGAPGISKIPILGALFRSRDFVHNQTELVIIATPYLVRPVARNKLSRPDDNFAAALDSQGYFMGRVNRIYGRKETRPPHGNYNGVVGYIYK